MPDLSVVIVTRNRKQELIRALRSVAMQTARIEIIVIDDASDDGTAEAVEREFPDARLVRSETRQGLIRQRNRGASLARAPFITTFDDDAELISPETFEVALGAFDHPRIAAVALPTIDLGLEFVLRNRAPDSERRYLCDTFPGAASLLRLDVYLKLGGFREELGNRGCEDSEYARRLFQCGYVVRIGTAPEVHHHVSANRDLREDTYLQARSQMLATFWSMRYRDFPRRAMLSLGHGLRNRRLWAASRGLIAGSLASVRYRTYRRALPHELLALLRRMERERLKQRYTLTLEDVESYLPEVQGSSPSRVRG